MFIPRLWEIQLLKIDFPGAVLVGFVPSQVQQEKVTLLLLSQQSGRTFVSLSLVLGCL